MDTSNQIQLHSEEKLSVYEEYLRRYLSVLTNQPYYQTINIIDLFAGMGVSENNKEGSALVAAKLIKDIYERKDAARKQKVKFFLNEKSLENYEKLKEALSEYDFPEITNKSANDFITALFDNGRLSPANIRNSRSLLFIDPHGYTQLSQNNLDKILQPKEIEILLFVPTNSIYRFKGTEGNPARKFVLNFGVEESILNNIKDIDSFAEELKKKLMNKASTDFVYSYKIENKNVSNSLFHLFFVTKHIKGAEKFLEAKSKIKESLQRQLTFLDPEEPKRTDSLKLVLSKETTNEDLYFEIIKAGYLAKEIKPILKEMESTGVLNIQVDFKRRKGAYYLKEKPDKTIFLRIKP